ncbi:MAG TPA: ABC transporter substrate-binding protein [Epulopiscium sp.]|nr:ABC transporter substrate-binding protein [Candidatus Epulonipiscium sp.]
MQIFKKAFAIALGITLAISISGCENTRNQKSLQKIGVAEVTHSVFYAPQYVAIEMGFFADEGFEIDLIGAYGADKTMAALLSQEAQIGFMGPEASVYVYAQGSKDYAISFAQVTKRDGTFLVSREPEPNFKFENLKGKEVIGGRKGGMPEMTLEYVLKNNDLILGENTNAGEVNVRTDIQYAVMAGAFTGGEGDYVALFEPMASSVVKAGTGHIVSSIGAESGEIPYTAYCTLESYMEENPEVIQKFTNAIYKGQQYVKDHSAEDIAKVINPQFPELEIDELVAVIQRYKDNDTWCDNPLLKEESLNRLMDVMELAGELKARVPYDKVVTTKFANEAVK